MAKCPLCDSRRPFPDAKAPMTPGDIDICADCGGTLRCDETLALDVISHDQWRGLSEERIQQLQDKHRVVMKNVYRREARAKFFKAGDICAATLIVGFVVGFVVGTGTSVHILARWVPVAALLLLAGVGFVTGGVEWGVLERRVLKRIWRRTSKNGETKVQE